MNKVFLIGRLGKEPESKEINGQKITRFTLATQRNKEKTDWHNVTMWGKAAEVAAAYAKKGNKVLVSGSVNYSEIPQADGTKKVYTEINCNDIELLDPKAENTPSLEIINAAKDDMKKEAEKAQAAPAKQPEPEQGDLPF